MHLWTIEHGTLWAADTAGGPPPLCSARVQAEFGQVRGDELGDLASAMGLPDIDPIQRRLQDNRRCFRLCVAGQIAAYGWVTRGPECVGELERTFHLDDDEAYIWDCATLPAWRGQRCYSALLSQMLHELAQEGTRQVWIGASLGNQASTRGFANAGFRRVVDLTYCRIYRLSLIWFRQTTTDRQPLVAAAYRILLSAHERRLGRLALGYKR